MSRLFCTFVVEKEKEVKPLKTEDYEKGKQDAGVHKRNDERPGKEVNNEA